ncbi:hypothetical protein KFK09_011394 [Dendrobium nobile]|uniref:Heparan-alpha-glucosaminide N-acetyltransferase n=1 Tax=Dendrobium nobile TaxID=94219 RepID=A0A8T3BFT8_DENNO|nr:hypothetical protein KFK09_011394 [Dendrobium nobile]
MDSQIVIPEERVPLLNSLSTPVTSRIDWEILPDHNHSPPPTPVNSVSHQTKPSDPNQRLASLDVFRGLTVALMILVDDAGGAFPGINHAPWFGVTIADFVMPFFLFGVGVSIALAYRRISAGYFLAAMSEIWLTSNLAVDSPMSFMKKYYIQWIVAIVLSAMYVALLVGVYVPNWEFEILSSNSTFSNGNFGLQIETVHCGLRGSLGPPCNAVGFIDRLILGEKHLYQNPVYKRTKECSINSPDYGPLPPNSPKWCLAPFDPEGILSSVMAAMTCFVGLQFGHVMMHFKSHMRRTLLWSMSSLVLLLFACIVALLGVPLSKPLYTLSYMFLTGGASGVALSFIYYLVDVKHIRKPSLLLQWMGMNALIVYVLAAGELFPAALQGFYWRSPSNNLVNLTESFLQSFFHSKKWGTLAFVLLEILFWCLVSGFLHLKGIYFKL